MIFAFQKIIQATVWFHVEQRQGADIQGFAGCAPPKAKEIKSMKSTPVSQAKLNTLAQSRVIQK